MRFRYRPHRDEDDPDSDPVVLTLSPEAFFARYLPHLPLPRLQQLRAYGLYGPAQRARLEHARTALGQPAIAEPKPLTPPEFLARFRHTPEAARCPRCGALLLFVSLTEHGPDPPTAMH